MKNSKLMDVTIPRVLSTFSVTVFAILWIGLTVALATERSWLVMIWNWVAALPTLLRVVVWLIFLPVLTGLWIWQSAWSTPVTLLALAGMLVWTYSAISAFMKAWSLQADGTKRSI